MTSVSADFGISTVENLCVISMAPISRPVTLDSLAIAPTRSCGRILAACPSETKIVTGAPLLPRRAGALRAAGLAVCAGRSRGAAITALVGADLDVAEYTPTQVKQAVVGTGKAVKAQVQEMVARLLKLPGLPGTDAADALGIAICHANSHDALALMGALAPANPKKPTLHMKRGRLV